MYFENDTIVRLKKEEQKNYGDAYQIHNGLLYHYAKIETLWNILESDSFFARNIRFSNDSNEYMTGRDTIQKFIGETEELSEYEKQEIQRQISENPMMYFMVCFCENGDLLSQWRGYAQNGVSIGLDFTDGIADYHNIQEHLEWFCVLNNKKWQESQRIKNDKNKYYLDNKTVKFLQMPYKVQYITKLQRNGKTENSLQKIEQQGEKQISVMTILKKLWDGSEEEERIGRLLKYIPFIKDDGFKEEEEYRLIFDMEFLGESKAHSRSVRSKKMEYLDSENMKKPYINVEFGQPEYKLSNVKKIRFGSDSAEVLDELGKSEELADIELEKDEKRKGIYIGEGIDQETILELIEKYTEAIGNGKSGQIKIWCAGHLPIREIVVGPGEKQNDIRESLEYFKNTVYWLRYIDIRISRIPLRV